VIPKGHNQDQTPSNNRVGPSRLLVTDRSRKQFGSSFADDLAKHELEGGLVVLQALISRADWRLTLATNVLSTGVFAGR
jgi:hypothetical protein